MDKSKPAQLDLALAWLLQTGSWIASILLIACFLLPAFGQSTLIPLPYSKNNLPLVTVGISVIILLPILRVMMMLIAFLTKRDYRLAAIAALVLLILFCAFALGEISA